MTFPCSGIILAGGRNTRFSGKNKAFLDVGGKKIIDRIYELLKEFYDEIIERPVPIDLRALSALKSSSLALDIYCWITYRMSYLKHSTEIPWELLAAQFGSDYAETRDFKKNFIKQLRKVLVVYNAKVDQGERGLILKPTKSHILPPKIQIS